MSRSPRRRSAPSKNRSASGGISTVALALGVIVAGLGIGALVSAFAHRGADHGVAIVSPTPTARVESTPTPLPVIVPTAVPTRKPTATPKPKKTARPTPSETASATPSASPSATPVASSHPTPSASASPTPEATPSLLGKPTPQPAPTPPAPTPVPKATLAASPPPPRVVPPSPPPVRTARPVTPAPTPTANTAAAEATPAAESGFTQAASSAVRRYLTAVIAGNTERASGYLSSSAGTGDEPVMLDRSAAITAVHARSTSPTTAHVEVDLSSSKGALFATYDVTQTAAGPRITNHEIIKP